MSETEIKPTIKVESVQDETDIKNLEAPIATVKEEAARVKAEADHLKQESDQATATTNTNSDNASSNDSNLKMDESASDSNEESSEEDEETEKSFSIFVRQVDNHGVVEITTTEEELVEHFEPCGAIERVYINCNKSTGRPEGFAYLEFQTEEAVSNALKLDGSRFQGKKLKVTTNNVIDSQFYYDEAVKRFVSIITKKGRRYFMPRSYPGFLHGPRFKPNFKGRALPSRGRGGQNLSLPPTPGNGTTGRGPRAGSGRGQRTGRGARAGRGSFRGGPAYHPYH